MTGCVGAESAGGDAGARGVPEDGPRADPTDSGAGGGGGPVRGPATGVHHQPGLDRALAASDQVEGRTTGRSSSWQQVYTVSQDWTELSLRLTKLKAALQVGRRHGNRCTPSARTGPSSRCV